MRDLNYQLKGICYRNRDGNYATRANRERDLDLFANQLHDLGFKNLGAFGLKPKHVTALVDKWRTDGIATGTMKNRLAHLRWWAEKIGKPDIIPASNDALNIPRRKYVTNESKAASLSPEVLDQVKDAHIRLSLELQSAFGLRREEALKFQPTYADKGDHILLKATWCKGGKSRTVPIRNDYQREVLQRAHQLAGRGSMIPDGLTYIQHLKHYERWCQKVGLEKMHGLRHAYAQTRYEEITGWKAPAAGGPFSDQLSKEQKPLDNKARLQISRELGHERKSVTSVYLGGQSQAPEETAFYG